MTNRSRLAIVCALLCCLSACGDTSLSRGEAEKVFLENGGKNGKSNGKIHTLLHNYLVKKSPYADSMLNEFDLRFGEGGRDGLYMYSLANFPRIDELEEVNDFYLLLPISKSRSTNFANEFSLEATGVRMLSASTAEVHYTWSRMQAEQFWIPFIQVKGEIEAQLAMFDDGWRIDSLKLTESERVMPSDALRRILAFHKEVVGPCVDRLSIKKEWAKVVVPEGWSPGSSSPVVLEGKTYCE